MILPKEKLVGLDPNFAVILTKIADNLPFTLFINEGVPASTEGSHVSDSEHFKGLGVDLKAEDGNSRYLIVKEALAQGIDRIGVYNLHVHLGYSTELPRPVMWGGVSH